MLCKTLPLVVAACLSMGSAGCGNTAEEERAAPAAIARRTETLDAAKVDAFHQLYYTSREATWKNTFWQGVSILKNPLDMWVYQELIHSLRPDLIVETGTAHGGSALYMAQLCDLLGQGNIVTVDIEGQAVSDDWRTTPRQGHASRPLHPRITYLTGSSTSPEIFARVRQEASGAATVLVILDSDHSMGHVLDEMNLYAQLVTPGSYMIVEDTNVGGHPVEKDFGPGPMEAVRAFLSSRQDFAVDAAKQKFFFTFNPSGFLRKSGGA